MSEKRKQQPKRIPARGGPSSEADDLREDTVAKFREIALDAYSFKQRFPTESPARRPLSLARAVKSVKLMDARAVAVEHEIAKWRKRSCKLIKLFVARLCLIRRNYSRLKSAVEAAQIELESECRKWIGVGSDLTERLMVDCDTSMKIEAMNKLWLENENALARAWRLALARAQRRILVGKKSEPSSEATMDVIQKTMVRHHDLPYMQVCDEVDDQYAQKHPPAAPPVPPRCREHGHKKLGESIRCGKCRNAVQVFLHGKRKPLALPRARKSNFRQLTNL